MKERTTKGAKKVISWGFWPFLRENLEDMYSFNSATLPIAATILASTSFWIALRDSSMVDSFSFWSKTSSVFFFFVCSSLKKSSLTSAGTLTPEMSTFVWVAITYDCGTRRRGDTIDGIWATDEQQTTVELLQEHDTLSLEATSQEDQHSPLGDASTELGLLAVVVMIAQLLLGVLRGVVPAGLLAYGGSDCRLSLPWLAHSFTLISRGDLHLYTDVPPC